MPSKVADSEPGLVKRILFIAVIAQLGLMLLIWSICAPLIAFVMSRPARGVLGRAAIGWMHRRAWASAQGLGLLRIDASALDVLAEEAGGLIVAANHPSMLDALIVVAHLPRAVCIMKADLMRNPLLGRGARLADYIDDGSTRAMLRDAVQTLQQGNQLLCFPEGTRTTRWPVGDFRSGVVLIAARASVPIQTVIIEIGSPYLGKGWPLFKVPPMPFTIRMRLGERFVPEADHRAMLARLETYFARELLADPLSS